MEGGRIKESKERGVTAEARSSDDLRLTKALLVALRTREMPRNPGGLQKMQRARKFIHRVFK